MTLQLSGYVINKMVFPSSDTMLINLVSGVFAEQKNKTPALVTVYKLISEHNVNLYSFEKLMKRTFPGNFSLELEGKQKSQIINHA